MKNLYKLSFFSAFLLLFAACESDDSLEIQNQQDAFQIENGGIADLTLNFSYPENPAFTLTVSQGASSSETQTVVMGTDAEVSNPVTLGTTTTGQFTISVADLNTILLDNGAQPFKPFTFFVRVTGNEATTDPVSYTALTYVTEDPMLNAPIEGTDIQLDNGALSEVAASISFNDFDTKGATVSVVYTLEVASESSFDMPQVVATKSSSDDGFSSTFEVTNQTLSNVASINGIAPASTGDLDFRLTATITSETGTLERFSDVQTLSVTTDAILFGPRLAVPGPHQNGGDPNIGVWNPDANENVAFVPYLEASSAGQTDYEGFVYLLNEFKMVESNDNGDFMWGNVDYEDTSGTSTFTGNITADGGGNCGVPNSEEGYYYAQVNTTDLTYSLQKTSWGIIGFATTGDDSGWSQDMDMTFNRETRTWSIMLDLSVGEFKFRANDAYDLNFGIAGDGSLEFNGPNLSVSESGTYEVILDLSNPRHYEFSLNLQ